MYLHLGANVLVKKDKIIAIIDLDTTKNLQLNRVFFNNFKVNSNITYICEEGREKTLVVTSNELFFSPISSTTLLKRSFSDNVDDYSYESLSL